MDGGSAKALFAISAEHEGFKRGSLQYGPEEYKLILAEWDLGKKPRVFGAEWKSHVSAA